MKQAFFQYAPIQDTNSIINTNGYQASANFGVSFARSSSVTAQIGINEGLTQTYGNYGVQHTLEIIESQLKRLEESSALGMWEFAAYVISKSPVVANNVAHMYLALTQGMVLNTKQMKTEILFLGRVNLIITLMGNEILERKLMQVVKTGNPEMMEGIW